MIEVFTRECKEHGTKTRVSLSRVIEIVESNYDDAMLVLYEMAKGNPVDTTFAVYRLEEFGVNELPRPLLGDSATVPE